MRRGIMSEYYARDGQLLMDHLKGTAELARHFAEPIGCGYLAYVCGLLHDLGKFSPQFQAYLQKSIRGDNVHRGEFPHAWLGALEVLEQLEERSTIRLADILSNVLASHHGGLTDMIADAERVMPLRLKTNDKTHNDEYNRLIVSTEVASLLKQVDWDELKHQFSNLCRRLDSKNKSFALHLAVKFLFSCLVDADRCNAAGINDKGNVPDWDAMEHCLDTRLKQFSNTTLEESPLNAVRTLISNQCAEQASRAPGVFTLSVPTGGGKTLSSLRFAIRHARANDLKRIIYVIPYLSIIDQTAHDFRKLFGEQADEWILEHHSNFLLETDNEDDENRYELATQRWDLPVIITTMVQFLESVFSNKASDLRKFHNMTQSVFVFDEVQALPVNCTHLFNGTINFLSGIGHSSCVLCSATQPALTNVERPLILSDNPALVSLPPSSKTIFKRTRLVDMTSPERTCEEIAELALSCFTQGNSILVVMNTKVEAQKVFEVLPDTISKFFLSTDMCPAHRLDVITTIRNALENRIESQQPIICISTQLIEAGVDISFDCVIRALAGFDSIIQVAGRCNRHGYSSNPQDVIIVKVADEEQALLHLPDITIGKQITSRLLGENILEEPELALEKYYEYKFGAPDQKSLMDYPLDKKGPFLFDLLGVNILARTGYKDAHNGALYPGLHSAFQSAAERFKVIDGFHIGVVVPYSSPQAPIKVQTLVEEYIKMKDDFWKSRNCEENATIIRKRSRILRSLQQYTISVYADQEASIQRISAKIDDSFYFLSDDYYDKVTGLTSKQGLLNF